MSNAWNGARLLGGAQSHSDPCKRPAGSPSEGLTPTHHLSLHKLSVPTANRIGAHLRGIQCISYLLLTTCHITQNSET